MENYKNSKIGRETAQKYGDILEMERPQTEESLRKHPRMTLSLIHISCRCGDSSVVQHLPHHGHGKRVGAHVVIGQRCV